MRECLLLNGCRYVFDPICPLFRGPCQLEAPNEIALALFLLAAAVAWGALFWRIKLGRG